MIRGRIILLVEDNPNDVKLTIHAFEQSNISNEIVVVGDGEEAIDYLFATGRHAGRKGHAGSHTARHETAQN
jgi:two-component system response regulator